MVDVVRKRAVASGHSGRPPITATELIENSRTAQSKTSVSTKTEKLRTESETNPQLTRGVSKSSACAANSGSMTIAGRTAAEKISSLSDAANIESRPVMAAEASSCVKSQSLNDRRVRGGRSRKWIPPWPLGTDHATRALRSTSTRGDNSAT